VTDPKPDEALADLFACWGNLDAPLPAVEDEPVPLDEEVF